MNIASRYLKVQKKRTLLTILGVILSVALITGVFTIIVSVRDKMINDTISRNGSFHIAFRNTPKDKIDKLCNHVNVDEFNIQSNEVLAIISETDKKDKDTPKYWTFSINGISNPSSDLYPISLKEGNLPTSPDEIAVDYWSLDYLPGNPKIGDTITLDIGTIESENDTFTKQKSKEYKIVGLLSPRYMSSHSYTASAITFLDVNNLQKNQNYYVFLKLKSPKNINNKIDKIVNDVGVSKENIAINNYLLALSGESSDDEVNKSLISLVGFIVALIIISTIAVIYNSFNISVIERISQFGILRCVGSTPQQIRKIVFKEALIISAFGIPLGLFSGTIAMKIVFYIIGHIGADKFFNDIHVVISPLVIIVSTILGLLTVYASAYIPARMASKISPLEAVRNTGQFKKDNIKKSKKGNMIQKLLGFEASLAWKNLRRNRKRFVITVFSMVISIVLFIVFNNFASLIFMGDFIDTSEKPEFIIYNHNSTITEQDYESISSIDGVEKIYKQINTNVSTLLNKDLLTNEYLEYYSNAFTEKENNIVNMPNNKILCYGDNNLAQFKDKLISGKIDIDDMSKNNGIILVKQTTMNVRKADSGKSIRTFFDLADIKVGDTIPLLSNDDEKTKLGEVNVSAIAETGILYGDYYCYNGGFLMITTEDVYKKFIGNNNYSSMYLRLSNDADYETVSKQIQKYCDSNNFEYIDYVKQAKQMRKNAIVVSIFLYGFVAVITLISCLNIINTINTNLLLRTREFSILKAVGMAELNVKKMVCYEGLYYGIIASFYGIIVGTGLSYVLFSIITNMREFGWTMPWKDIVIATVGILVFTLLSAYLPLKKMNKQSLVDNIRMEH